MPSLEVFLQFFSNRKNTINYNRNEIEINTQADRRKLKKIKCYLFEAMNEYIEECEKVPMEKSVKEVFDRAVEEARRENKTISYRRLLRKEFEKTEEGEITSQIVELYKESGNSIQIDKNGICKITIKGKEIYVNDQELIHLIEKLEIYDKADENSIYSDIKAIKQNIMKNLFNVLKDNYKNEKDKEIKYRKMFMTKYEDKDFINVKIFCTETYKINSQFSIKQIQNKIQI